MENTNLRQLVGPKFFWGMIMVLLLLAGITFYMLQENERTLRMFTQKQLTETIREKHMVQKRFVAVKEELTAEKEKSYVLEKEVEEKERQIVLTLEKLEKETAARRQAEAHLIIAMEGKRVLEEKLRGPARRSKTVKLGAIIVKPAPLLTGKVLAVNEAYDFIIVDLGRANDMTVGDILSVYRNDGLIGRVQVEKVEEKNSAAAILPEWQGVEFKENDEVRGI